jgi:hypothetical protein
MNFNIMLRSKSNSVPYWLNYLVANETLTFKNLASYV